MLLRGFSVGSFAVRSGHHRLMPLMDPDCRCFSSWAVVGLLATLVIHDAYRSYVAQHGREHQVSSSHEFLCCSNLF